MTPEFKNFVRAPGVAITRPGTPYGRGPADLSLADCREMTLMHERMLMHGPILKGQTVYRYHDAGGWGWRALPDPEKKP